MDSGGRSSDAARGNVGAFFRSPKERRAAASKRFLEDGRGFTAGNGGGPAKYVRFSGAPPVATGRKKQSRVPLLSLLRSGYVLIYGYTYDIS